MKELEEMKRLFDEFCKQADEFIKKEKEKEYKIALNQKALQLRAEDMPVTLINQVIYGYKDIALLRLARDTAQVKYNANQEFINVLKLEIRIIENQIAREYGNTK